MPGTHPFGTQIDIQQLHNDFRDKTTWEDRYRQLITLSKQLPALPEALKQSQIELKGCENRVWLGHQLNDDGTLHFYGDSEGRIVKGILAILFIHIEGKTPRQISQLNLIDAFHALGLYQPLSTSRIQGLTALIDRIQQTAQAYL